MSRVSRRDFFVTTAIGAVAATTTMAQTPAPAATQPSAEAAARYEWIIGKWGAHLTDEQKSEIRRLVSDNEKGLAPLRAFAIGNDAGPALPFRVYRKGVR